MAPLLLLVSIAPPFADIPFYIGADISVTTLEIDELTFDADDAAWKAFGGSSDQ